MFEIPKMQKFEDRIEAEAHEYASDKILSHYGISEIEELTEEQVNEIQQFIDDNDGTVACKGLQNCIDEWEDIQR